MQRILLRNKLFKKKKKSSFIPKNRLIYSIIALSFLFTPIYAQEKFTFKLENTPVVELISKIEKGSNYTFLFNDQIFDSTKKVSINVQEASLEEILELILAETATNWEIKDNQIILTKKNKELLQANFKPYKLRGEIKDSKGETLIGVNVIDKQTQEGVITDFDGNFEILIKTPNPTLSVSYMGYETQIIKLQKNQTTIKITLTEEAQLMQEVVVTAMGIERKQESLTYATQQLGGKELTRAKDVNFINALQGKSAGLTIIPNTSSGAGGGSSKIILRGQSSILGNNQPLIVLDGIPLSSGLSGQTSNIVTGTSRDNGDLLSTINPDDIANVSILKGPNAAALYGSAANNGVIIITTKGAREGKLLVNVSVNSTFETPLVYPEQQNHFAPEIEGLRVKYNAWGKPISEITDDEIALFPYLTRNPRNNIRDFFNIGQTYNTSVSISGGNQTSSNYFSYSNTMQKGLLERNTYVQHNLLFKENLNFLNDRLKVNLSLNYIRQERDNTPIIGMAKGSLPGLYLTPSAVDLRYFDKNRTHIAQDDDPLVTDPGVGNKNLIGHGIQTFPWVNNSWINNPYFMLDATDDKNVRDRIMANSTVSFDITKDLTAQSRFSFDQTSSESISTEYASIRGDKSQSSTSFFWGGNNKKMEIYGDFLLTYDTKLTDNIKLNTTVGTSFKRQELHKSYIGKYPDTTYVQPNMPWPRDGWNGTKNPENRGNTLGANHSGYLRNWEAAIFSTIQLGLWDLCYLDFSIREDWAKPFQQFSKDGKYKGFAYYSLGGNVLLKELLFKNIEEVNNVKFRASYSVVGNSVPDRVYNAQTVNPITGAISAKSASFDNPKPETTKAFESGIDATMFHNKLQLDLTVYQSIMENQFLEITTSSGQTKPVNSGKVRNRGIEFSANHNMNFHPVRWTTGINIAYNTNKILETYKPKNGANVDMVVSAGGLSIQSKFIKGGAYGDLYGKDFYYEDDKIKIDDGKPMISQEYDKFLGNTMSKINYGWNNTFQYKDLSLYVLIDGKIGGKVISLTEAKMDSQGLSKRSAEARLNNNGKVILPDGQEVDARAYYEIVGSEQFDCAYDATNLRLREISISYTFYDLLGASRNLSLSLNGRNLGFIYKNSPIDPDASVTAGNAFSGIEIYSLPSTRSFGLSAKLTF